MGVVSNKINIMELMKSGGGGDPTIPGRVSALENEMSGVYASINKISTVELPKVYSSINEISTVELPKVYSSINEISTVELPKVYSSISAVSDLILKPVTGLEDRVEEIEEHTPKIVKIPLGVPISEQGTAAKNVLRVLAVKTGEYYESDNVPSGSMFIPFYAYLKDNSYFAINSIVLKKGTDSAPLSARYNYQRVYRGSNASTSDNKIHIIAAYAHTSGASITDVVVSGVDGSITLNDLSDTLVYESDNPYILAYVF